LFLCSLYENDIILKKEYLDEEILSNNILFKKKILFENMDLSDLEKRYFNESHYLKTNTNLKKDEIFSLLYLFFKSEYYVLEDDYIGVYSVRKNNDNEPD